MDRILLDGILERLLADWHRNKNKAPYLPWVLLGFSVLLYNTIWVDLMGMIVGHCYYYLEDVFPHQNGGLRIIKTSKIFRPKESSDSSASDADQQDQQSYMGGPVVITKALQQQQDMEQQLIQTKQQLMAQQVHQLQQQQKHTITSETQQIAQQQLQLAD